VGLFLSLEWHAMGPCHLLATVPVLSLALEVVNGNDHRVASFLFTSHSNFRASWFSFPAPEQRAESRYSSY
jgi:hypothetical protein